MITHTRSAEFERACATSEINLAERLFDIVGPDIGAGIDERDLGVYIWNVVNDLGREWFQIDIPLADCDAANFPAFFVFFYVYYFRYVKNSNVKPDINDFNDLLNCLQLHIARGIIVKQHSLISCGSMPKGVSLQQRLKL